MNPLNTGLALLVVAMFFAIFGEGIEKATKSDNYKIPGGLAVLLLFIDIIWAIFYYL